MTVKAKFSKLCIKIFGDIQLFPQPLFCMLWGSTHYLIKGPETRHVMNIIKRGDILILRLSALHRMPGSFEGNDQ